MTMLDLALFYDPGNWTRRFWASGSSYTIVKGRHIGLDIGTQGKGKPVPALLPGPIVDYVDVSNLGRVVIQDVSESGSDYKYLSYCHMSKYDPPRVGYYLHHGEEFGRIATGPKSLGFGHPNYPGSSWSGPHLHLVWHNKVRGAYMLGQNDTYGNPEDLIRNILATPAGGGGFTPFKPEGFLMALSDAQQAQVYDALVKHGPTGDYYTPDAVINILRAEIAPAVAQILLGNIRYPGTNWNAFETLVNVSREDDGNADRPSAVPEVDEAALAANLATTLAPLLIDNLDRLDDETVDRIAQRVADVQASRLTN